MKQQIFIPTEEDFRLIVKEVVENVLANRLPQTIRNLQKKDYLTTSELKELTGYSPKRQKDLRDRGDLNYYQTGKKILYRTSEVEEYLNSIRVGGRR